MRRILLLYACVLVLLSAALLLAVRSSEPVEPPIPSTFSYGPSGYRALYTLLEEEARPVRRWAGPLRDLDDESSGSVLFLAGPALLPVEEADAVRMKAWVGAGNTLVFLSGEGDPPSTNLPPDLGESAIRRVFDLAIESPPGPGDPREEDHFLPNRVEAPETSGVESLCAGDSREVSLRAPGAVPFYGVEGERAAWRMPVGRGWVYLFPSTRYFSNRVLAKGDNLALALNLVDLRLNGGEILFDESHHGLAFRVASPFWRAPGTRGGAGIGAILLLLFLGSRAVRFGEPVPLERDPRRRGMEYVEALANLFRKGRKGEYILRSLADPFRRRAAAWAGIPRGAPDAELCARLRSLLPSRAGAVGILFDALRGADEGRRIGDPALLRATRALREIEEAMDRWQTG